MAELDCRKCKSWKGCPGKEWYSFSEFRWCAQQVFWALKYAWILRQGLWPSPESLVEGGVRGRQTITEGRFVKATLIISEIDSRIETTGWRGLLLKEECINRDRMIYLSDNAKDALYYVAGWDRKPRSFSGWVKDRKYHKKAIKMS